LRASELADSLQLTFNGAVVISIPSLTLPLVDFVAQGTPIPAIEGTSAAINLEPYKMAVITSLSGEILRQQRSDRASSVARERWPGARCGDVFRHGRRDRGAASRLAKRHCGAHADSGGRRHQGRGHDRRRGTRAVGNVGRHLGLAA
jgi:hypothetical protein